MNFIRFTNTGDYQTKGDKTLEGNVLYIAAPWTALKCKLGRLLCHLHLSKTSNTLFGLPFRSLWNRKYLASPFPPDEKVTFIFNAHFYWIDDVGGLDYIRKHYKNSKIVLSLSDTYKFFSQNYRRFPSPEKLKERFDAVVTYNTKDAEKYHFIHQPVLARDFSKDYVNVPVDETIPLSDVLFVGRSKDRLQELHELYRRCTACGLKCDFHIVGVEEADRLQGSDIEYDRFLPYEEILRRVKRTNCVLNYVYGTNGGATMRDYEAIGNNKFLLTNNPSILNTILYSPDQVFFLDELEEKADMIKAGRQAENRFAGLESEETLFTWLEGLLEGKAKGE